MSQQEPPDPRARDAATAAVVSPGSTELRLRRRRGSREGSGVALSQSVFQLGPWQIGFCPPKLGRVTFNSTADQPPGSCEPIPAVNLLGEINMYPLSSVSRENPRLVTANKSREYI